ncbi:hypothetical protein FDK21_17985 [Cohaesibacter sp. CAU 1516]|uniref:hypothetical protein n=1 Tax=Cohaesibacter sp. CAU 1516 TaxID=2576038 RepID=UPI0010FE61C0|nr:hypothetical protein [Cohaesibacter sp. CAU 1516]TLP43441.1 hypothetical protein FDK21_17985 [Cohaesibacter sp. CAU 1516]
MTNHPQQYGFDALLADADTDNKTLKFERETVHLPGTMSEAIEFHHRQITQHHAAMLDNDFETAITIREEARQLARKLNGNEPGIIAHDDAPGCVLARKTATEPGIVPFWGQEGTFQTTAANMTLNVSMGGIFGIGATAMPYLGFSVRATDQDKPFLSSTGYRSFLGVSIPPEPHMDVEAFVRRVVEIHVKNELNNRLVSIAQQYHPSD